MPISLWLFFRQLHGNCQWCVRSMTWPLYPLISSHNRRRRKQQDNETSPAGLTRRFQFPQLWKAFIDSANSKNKMKRIQNDTQYPRCSSKGVCPKISALSPTLLEPRFRQTVKLPSLAPSPALPFYSFTFTMAGESWGRALLRLVCSVRAIRGKSWCTGWLQAGASSSPEDSEESKRVFGPLSFFRSVTWREARARCMVHTNCTAHGWTAMAHDPLLNSDDHGDFYQPYPASRHQESFCENEPWQVRKLARWRWSSFFVETNAGTCQC